MQAPADVRLGGAVGSVLDWPPPTGKSVFGAGIRFWGIVLTIITLLDDNYLDEITFRDS